MNKKLYRDEYHKVLGGVCSGLADYFDMDVTVVRLLFAFTFFIMGVGLGTYIILWIVLPKKGYPFNTYNNPTVDYTVPPQQPGDQFTTPPPPQNNPFNNNPFANSPYQNNPFANNPMRNVPLKQKSNAGIIVGVVLIIIGAAVLIDNYDLFPDFDFERVWPAILVLVGGALIVSGQKRRDWHNQDLHEADKNDNSSIDNPSETDTTTTV
jgi:phage shock protein C